ncbi:MAG: hypothetical protein OEY56_13860 [Cyclobacteriaceae bacterium]|nr:hypothetical protein [Cyclobacteriaceae bacterium]
MNLSQRNSSILRIILSTLWIVLLLFMLRYYPQIKTGSPTRDSRFFNLSQINVN